MPKKIVLGWVAVVILGCNIACDRSRMPQKDERASLHPLNLVVVTIDTLRPDHLHCYGYSKTDPRSVVSVPASGVLFENAVTQTPLTPPSHASIFTGLYPTVHHVRDTG